jgi:hypothetical protein
MEKFLNAVYDVWIDDIPQPNLEIRYGQYRFRTVAGFFSFYGMYDLLKNCKIQDVYDNPNEIYYYFINGINDIENSIKENENLLPITGEVEKCFLTCSNFFIVLLHEHEFESENCFKLLNQIIEKKSYDANKFYMINNNSLLEDYKKKYNSKINVHSLDFLVKINAKNLSENPCKFVTEKEGFAMSHNRTVKPHRYGLLSKLKKEGLLDSIDWSLVMGWERKRVIREVSEDWDFYYNVFDEEEINQLKPFILWLQDIDIKKSKYEEDHTWFDIEGNHHGIDWHKTFEMKTYENSYVNISTESCYLWPEIHITDKTIKPLFFYQLPIFVASYQHVKFVRERFGLDVFDDIIDHSYDNEPDNRKRFTMIFDEIKRVHSIKPEIIKFYKNNEERFKKNREIILELKNSTKDVDYFKQMIDKKL